LFIVKLEAWRLQLVAYRMISEPFSQQAIDQLLDLTSAEAADTKTTDPRSWLPEMGLTTGP